MSSLPLDTHTICHTTVSDAIVDCTKDEALETKDSVCERFTITQTYQVRKAGLRYASFHQQVGV